MLKVRDAVAVPVEDIQEVIGTILEALHDYAKWWSDDEERLGLILQAIGFAEKLEASSGDGDEFNREKNSGSKALK